MHYAPDKRDHGFKHDPLKAIVAPRPIGWISTLSKSGIANIAPYSFFNAIASSPDMVCFSSGGMKDSAQNIKDTGEFVCNYVSQSLTQKMVHTSIDAPHDVSEFELAELEFEASKVVAPARVKETPAALECKLADIIQVKNAAGELTNNFLIIGEVVSVYINDDFITDGRFDVEKAEPVTRLGYLDYQKGGELFEMRRPLWKADK
ncbi:MAG: flavin reductase family protein [Rhizobiales bacterium]|nr:flavin reductase family protein [Hyphomicrobiales bacterium]